MKVWASMWLDCMEGGTTALFSTEEKAIAYTKHQAKKHNKTWGNHSCRAHSKVRRSCKTDWSNNASHGCTAISFYVKEETVH